MRHIREVHPHFEGVVMCGIDGCPATPSTYIALRQHMYRFHKDKITDSTSQNGNLLSSSASISDESEVATYNPEDSIEESSNGMSDLSPPPSTQVTGAKFILKTRDGRKLTQVATNGIVEDAKLLVQNAIQNMQKLVVDKLEQLGTVITDCELIDLKALFHDESLNPFAGLGTEYLQDKFIREHFNYVVWLHA